MKHPPSSISTIDLTGNHPSCNIPANASTTIDGTIKAKHITKIATTKTLSTLNLLISDFSDVNLYQLIQSSDYCFLESLNPIQQGTNDNQYSNHFDYGVYDAFQTKPLGHIFYQYPSDEDTNCGVYKCVNHIQIFFKIL